LAGKILVLLRMSAIAGGVLAIILLVWFREPLSAMLSTAYELLVERERFSTYVASYGAAAPLVFIAIQILQVIFAPIPGEATGVIGGFLFGAFKGCLYSTIALTVGSWINFSIGRLVGKRWVRKIVPSHRLARFDHIIRHQGVLVVFILFLIPGFPKDYLCLVIGVSTMPMRVFLILAGIGRIPGTLMLSLQGALVFEQNYFVFCVVVAINLLIVYFGYRYREALYRRIEKINGGPQQ
jgi:uncharacterized membrane protein YdjX (TVP38/TMEM64 family)